MNSSAYQWLYLVTSVEFHNTNETMSNTNETMTGAVKSKPDKSLGFSSLRVVLDMQQLFQRFQLARLYSKPNGVLRKFFERTQRLFEWALKHTKNAFFIDILRTIFAKRKRDRT